MEEGKIILSIPYTKWSLKTTSNCMWLIILCIFYFYAIHTLYWNGSLLNDTAENNKKMNKVVKNVKFERAKSQNVYHSHVQLTKNK